MGHFFQVRRHLFAPLWAFCFLLAPFVAKADINVFAAASLKTVLEDIGAAFETEHGLAVAVTVAGSSALARQISFGAPADVFVSANADWMNYLEARGHVISESRRSVAGNALVLVRSKAKDANAADATIETALSGVGDARIAVALVDAVPAGIYAKQALKSLGYWKRLSPNLVQTDNVRAALTLVALGEAPWGIVYASDALVEPRVDVVAVFPENSHSQIVYPAATIVGGKPNEARDFLQFLAGEQAQQSFLENGFTAIGDDE
ncbi:molybdate transport system substrate-binding protein [Shimia isoporae]|uniref:Molybdate transport system substrate-binding protein n=1 Tax=Shimia isoporae TaxID=647720 RepID=A0A4V2Q254_9RHOB|nr:molybdate ABC transporter substrate-binding protein [Shimia isoporae]TCL01131.1 molybdate transport system substrate-binding protein [Shimia isoporae]